MDDKTDDLPPDNAARLAIYDALDGVDTGSSGISREELFDRAIGRLRVLVPRELHLAGERAYVDEKIEACIEAGIISTSSDGGQLDLALTGRLLQVRYPDGTVRDYTPGLELARERLDQDNSRLRLARFDVTKLIPSIADDAKGEPFQALLASMREHGFMKQFPIVGHEDGAVVDGRARVKAAEILNLNVEYFKHGSAEARTAAKRRDTPLARIVVALDSNASRLLTGIADTVHSAVAAITRRPWEETAADLQLTKTWRQSVGKYSAVFEVSKLPYRPDDEPKIQVTPDDKVMLRSLIETAGLSNYKMDYLSDYVPFERARSAHSAGRKAVFARAGDLITGIATMQKERRAAKLKLDPEWEQIREWLVATFATPQE